MFPVLTMPKMMILVFAPLWNPEITLCHIPPFPRKKDNWFCVFCKARTIGYPAVVSQNPYWHTIAKGKNNNNKVNENSVKINASGWQILEHYCFMHSPICIHFSSFQCIASAAAFLPWHDRHWGAQMWVDQKIRAWIQLYWKNLQNKIISHKPKAFCSLAHHTSSIDLWDEMANLYKYGSSCIQILQCIAFHLRGKEWGNSRSVLLYGNQVVCMVLQHIFKHWYHAQNPACPIDCYHQSSIIDSHERFIQKNTTWKWMPDI